MQTGRRWPGHPERLLRRPYVASPTRVKAILLTTPRGPRGASSRDTPPPYMTASVCTPSTPRTLGSPRRRPARSPTSSSAQPGHRRARLRTGPGIARARASRGTRTSEALESTSRHRDQLGGAMVVQKALGEPKAIAVRWLSLRDLVADHEVAGGDSGDAHEVVPLVGSDALVQVVPGLGEIAGAALARHKGVDKVSFTGSPEVGREIAVQCAKDFQARDAGARRAHQREPAGARHRLHREGPQRGRRARRRWRPGRRQGLLRGADGVRRRRQRPVDRPGRDLRSRRARAAVRCGRRGDRHRQYQPDRASRNTPDPPPLQPKKSPPRGGLSAVAA
jgi:Aldehyde dehydrogenase family